jgi:CHAD domain-containing protein
MVSHSQITEGRSEEHRKRNRGLGHWMSKVLSECAKVEKGFDPDAVHDLRTALRRCRTAADGLRQLDSDKSWKKLKKGSKKLFRSMGQLRDRQVMREWIEQLAPQEDPFSQKLLAAIAAEEPNLRAAAQKALDHFDRKAWKKWCRALPERARKVPKEGLAFQHLALERWQEAHNLHARVLRRSSRVGWHRLRIGLKRFRYLLENFLPRRYEQWAGDLKTLQDLLGEVHDLDVLWAALRKSGISSDPEAANRWGSRIDAERSLRLAQYREMMRGSESRWELWRRSLPEGSKVDAAAVAKLSAWASYMDSDLAHSQRVRDLALELFDGFRTIKLHELFQQGRGKRILQCAALLHDVGRSRADSGHHKVSYRIIRDLPPPIGWTREDMLWTALIARYHRGAEPRVTHEGYGALSPVEQERVAWLAATLRLADSLDGEHDGRVLGVRVETTREAILIAAPGYSEDMALSSEVAGKKHLLETLCGRPVILRPASIKPESVFASALAS